MQELCSLLTDLDLSFILTLVGHGLFQNVDEYMSNSSGLEKDESNIKYYNT